MNPVNEDNQNHPFLSSLEANTRKTRSAIVLALDLPYREDTSLLYEDALQIIKDTSPYICAVKFNFHLILPLALEKLALLNQEISGQGLQSIADLKLNDIDNTNLVASKYLWKAGFSAVIVNPFVGYEGGLDFLIESARTEGKGVIFLAYMSHKGASEGYGLNVHLEGGARESMFELFLRRARNWNADGVIVGATRPREIANARKILEGSKVKIFSPGHGIQGGDPLESLKAGADYMIYGRSVVESGDPKKAIMELHSAILPWIESR